MQEEKTHYSEQLYLNLKVIIPSVIALEIKPWTCLKCAQKLGGDMI